ncbi:MAG: alpha/beta fold hydrolase [Elusimicrobia bacterium]|nr:alpha/beta fold hydrolase [Elusimicrobiota bacterium]
MAIVAAILGWWLYLQTDLILAPEPFAMDNHPEEFGLRYEPVEFQSADGARLMGWWVPSQENFSDRTIICGHGWGTNSSDILPSTWYLAREGFNIFYFDFRGCGRSPSHGLCSLGYYERRDMEAAIEFIKTNKAQESRFLGIYGLSMGGVTALAAGAGERGGYINALAVEASFAGFHEVVTSYIKLNFGLPRFPGADIFVALLRWRTRWVDHEAWSPRTTVKKIQTPHVFLIYGANDGLVPVSVFEDLAAGIRGRQGVYLETWLVPGAGHAECFDEEPGLYRTRLVSFFNRAALSLKS